MALSLCAGAVSEINLGGGSGPYGPDMNLSRDAIRSVVVSGMSLLLALDVSGRAAVAGDGGVRGPATAFASREKQKQPKTAASSFDRLRVIGEQIARAMTAKKFEQIYPFLCTKDKGRTTAKAFGGTLRELHTAAETTTVELGKDDEIVSENRRAGAKAITDLANLPTVLLPFRLHAPGHSGGDSTSIQAWSFHRENDSWCTPLDNQSDEPTRTPLPRGLGAFSQWYSSPFAAVSLPRNER